MVCLDFKISIHSELKAPDVAFVRYFVLGLVDNSVQYFPRGHTHQ